MPAKTFKRKQVHWEAIGRSVGRGTSVGRRWGWGWVAVKGGSDANICTAIEQLCICIWVKRDYTEG